ncbi:MAG: 5-(carboxyamino)imidazole ribonucleotide synthase [Salaquimonas sp.]
MSNQSYKPLKSGDTIGILGGGQLGRMLAMSAAKFGLKTIILEPGSTCPAAQTSNQHINAAYDDMNAVKELVELSDLVTYEFENIPLDTVNFLEENTMLFPGSLALAKSQDRLIEKQFINSLGIATAPYYTVEKIEDIKAGLHKIGPKAILKTRRFGYDGKGQTRLDSSMSADELGSAYATIGNAPALLEGFITFSREISIIIARGRTGDATCYAPAENVHKDGILHTSTLPAAISDETAGLAKEIATKLVNALEYVGVMGVEFFVEPDGGLIVNEIAPRVHNSGHWTEAACSTSQFDQHIRAIAGWPLGSTVNHSNCVMENLIGDDIDRVPHLLEQSSIFLHLYGKSEARPGRKMGHFTILSKK